MRISHYTSPNSATEIIRSGIFYPASTHPLNNDNGLNCFRKGQRYWPGQYYEGFGAKLILEWSGPIVFTDKNTSPPLPTDVLHDQHPWRCFIRGGTSAKYLRVANVRFEKGEIDTLLEFPSFYRLLPTTLREKMKRRGRLRFLLSLRDLYRSKNLSVTVVG